MVLRNKADVLLKKNLILCEKKILKIFLIATFFPISLFSRDQFNDVSCEDCHDDITVKGSVHEDIGCTDCHKTILDIGLEHATNNISEEEGIFDLCGSCHEDANDEYLESVHGKSLTKPDSEKEAAYCFSCHGSHDILPSNNPESRVYPRNIAETCGTCHAKEELVEKYNIPDLRPVELFSKSYHAKQLKEGTDLMAATCNDCHGIHNIKRNTDPTSSISHSNIAKTCGTCHRGIFEKYSKSVHWEALIRGERESPACVDCHGEHEILLPSDSESSVSKRSVSERTCSRCHTNERLIRKYGLTEGKVSSYQDSYHGLAVLKGDENAATCYDCHNAHEILPATDKSSSIHPLNLKNTCSKCHPGATDNFAQSYTHESVIVAEKPVEYYVKVVYLFLIVVIIGAMVTHNSIILFFYLARKFKGEKSYDYIQRYSYSQVWQHLILLLSFFTLVITGFALRFTDALWVEFLTKMGLTESLRSLIHRIAAVILVIVSIWHMIELFAMRSGRQFFRELLPHKKDVSHFKKNIKYYFGRYKVAPQFSQFDYTEKVEYWGMVWGIIIMVITGFILWFPTYFGKFPVPWLIKVSETIHYYEAWLAALSILVWHFFFVLLHPREYPMSMTWLHGRMSIAEYKHKHPEELKKIMSEIKEYEKGMKSIDDLCFQAKEYVIRHKTNANKKD